jgi:RHS repeat-associated protein
LIRSDHNGQVTEYGYDVFGRRLYKKNQNAQTLTLFGWDGDLMIWESQQSKDFEENYTKHYIYEPQSFVPLLQTGYTGFIKLLETPDYAQFQHEEYSVYKDPIWKTETRKNKAELERVLFYHCDQVGTPQTLTNELGECVWEIKQDTWGTALEIKTSDNLLEQTSIRFQGQYYDNETGLHYNRYRYYESHSARYVSKDPIGLFGGLNSSAYVKDLNQWVDPLGLQGEKVSVDGRTVTGTKYYRRNSGMRPLNAEAILFVQKDRELMVKQKYEKFWKGVEERANRECVKADESVSTHIPYTTMTNINLGAAALFGGSGGFGVGHTKDERGEKSYCIASTVCGTGGAEASAYGSIGQSYTNTGTSKGFSTGGAVCGSAKGAAIIGASVQGCQNTDGSQTGSTNLVIGGAAGGSAGVCYTANYCR